MFFPVVLEFSSFEKTVFVFYHLSFMKPARGGEGPSVHFSDISTVVTRVRKVFNPASGPIVGILENSRRMGEMACKETRS